MTSTNKKRVTVQVWEKLEVALEMNLKKLHLKRDLYLNELLTNEIEALAVEIKTNNSDEVMKYLVHSNRNLRRTKLNLELDETLINRIDEVLLEKKIPRDSFINRILYFLLKKSSVFVKVDYKYVENSDLFYEIQEERDNLVVINPFEGAKNLLFNPFRYIRSQNENRFYTLEHFPDGPLGKNGPNLFSLNVSISDEFLEAQKFNLDDI